jgi:hypothetical protein
VRSGVTQAGTLQAFCVGVDDMLGGFSSLGFRVCWLPVGGWWRVDERLMIYAAGKSTTSDT